MDYQIFISYASDDKAAADQVCLALEASGMTCWIAPRNIGAGADFPSAILQGISSTRLMIVILSAGAVSSPHVLSEIDHAFNQKRPIIPVRLSSVTLPKDFDYFLATQQWLEAPDGCTDEVLKRVVGAASEILAGNRIADYDTKASHRSMWGGGAIAVIILLLGLFTYFQSKQAPDAKKDTTGVVAAETAAGSNITATLDKRAPAMSKTWTNPKDGQIYVWIPPGSFTMGCSAGDDQCGNDEKPAHRVDIAKGFWIAQTEVTNQAYFKAGGRDLSIAKGDPKLPVRGLSWMAAKAYCAIAGGRLPTEAEWEYAARAGTSESYYGAPSRVAWYASNSDDTVHPVGLKEPNGFGLYDVLGNVSEWVLDRYYNRYDLEAPAVGPQIEQPLAGNASAVARGGFWAAEPEGIRVSHRSEMLNDQPSETAGVRCVSDSN